MSDDSIPRREFVAGATAVATGLALTSDTLASGNHSLYNLKHAEFAQLIGQSFEVDGLSEQGSRQRATLVLKGVVPHDTDKDVNRPSHVRLVAFSLHFESNDATLINGTHNVTGGGFATQGIFLHEMLDQRKPGCRQYEAVFN